MEKLSSNNLDFGVVGARLNRLKGHDAANAGSSQPRPAHRVLKTPSVESNKQNTKDMAAKGSPMNRTSVMAGSGSNMNVMGSSDNYYVDRRSLWSNLVSHASFMRNRPWVLLGDFNAALNLEDHSCGGYAPDIAMREFKQCVVDMEVMDINSTGLHFTWNQKPRGSNGTLKKIDRIMGNLHFGDVFPGSFAIFQPYRISDHSPCVLRVPHVTKPKPKPFKFSNFLVYKEGFLDTVSSGWNQNVNGCAMFRVVKRLNGLKPSFRKLLHNQVGFNNRLYLLYDRSSLTVLKRSLVKP
ncbi:RNA-directed DNA polymerase, eukaryota, Reverse transcriptase zinc-binding domain protein [Artemisia annua]|uniref:RNA-directed DNA polymerase, eukaryota, Reverse transcriptase zinc-binding domain protein n=1 Tax=Artemisia annua TaxID=35608 RepID=A0A2U1M0A9_ARTAN|nr:RNA-directed DNA polymerase, eukaryota, Reverse transcriptase zinc-binding domain protein [Artemisia annua]